MLACGKGDAMRYVIVVGLVLALACGGDSSGPNPVNFSGTYHGDFYVIATSTNPVERDSITVGPATLTLANSGGNNYHLSVTTPGGGSTAELTIDQAGAMGFPNYDPDQAIEVISSVISGVCEVSSAVSTPSGSVVGGRLTVTSITTGATCDWGPAGSDTRPTIVQLTWTGTR
jgi:hypothetical protein